MCKKTQSAIEAYWFEWRTIHTGTVYVPPVNFFNQYFKHSSNSYNLPWKIEQDIQRPAKNNRHKTSSGYMTIKELV